jgi:hypothetical protein
VISLKCVYFFVINKGKEYSSFRLRQNSSFKRLVEYFKNRVDYEQKITNI